jgi:hypothetical protein
LGNFFSATMSTQIQVFENYHTTSPFSSLH